MTLTLSIVFVATALLFLAMTVSTLFHLRWAHRLPSLATLTATDGMHRSADNCERCTVVIASRDEETRIEGTIRHLLVQDHVQVEIIVVDDRSTDRTTVILQQLSQQNARVHVKRVNELPDGWLGKCHACHIGAQSATSEWLLFTDADCWLKSDVIIRALRVAARDSADHITLTPGIAPESVGAQAWHLAFLISLANWFSGVNRDRPKAYLGMGAFNLVKVSAYHQCGGYETLKLTVLDDVKLGLLLHRAGKRTRGFIGGNDVECHWGTTVTSMIKIMEKNYFAALDFRFWTALAASQGGMLFWGIGLAGPLTGTLAGIAAGLCLLSLIIPAYLLARRLGWPFAAALLTPFIFPLLFYAVFNSMFATVRNGGIRWRGTFYPLDTLRSGTVR